MSARQRTWIFVAVALVCVLAIWLPFGFGMTGLIEEWQELGNFTVDGPVFFANIVRPEADALRPMSHLPFAAAYVLGPNSLVSWHLLLMLALVVKGCASGQLAYRATGSFAVALVAAALIVLYPADTMQLSFRALHINWSLSLALLACSIYVYAWDRRRPGVAVVAAAAGLLAILVYEVALTCFVIPFLVVFARDGLRGLLSGLRDRLALLWVWVTAAALYLVYAIWMSGRVATYQASLISGRSLGSLFTQTLPQLFTIGESRAILGGWFDAAQILASEYRSLVYPVVAALVLAGLVWAGSRKAALVDAPAQGSRMARLARLAGIGIALIAAGYLPYLSSPAHMAISQRTYLFASFGAVLLWTALLLGMAFVSRLLAASTAVALLLLGLGAQLVQFEHYARIADVQRNLLRGIVGNFDGNMDGKTLIVVDGSNYLGQTWVFLPVNLRLALEYFYQHRLNGIEICRAPSMEWIWQDVNLLPQRGICSEAETEWVFHTTEEPAEASGKRIAKDRAIVIRIGADGHIVSDPRLDAYRTELQSGRSKLATRYRNVLAPPTWDHRAAIFGSEGPGHSYHGSFGRWWSMDIPMRGYGWRETEWEVSSRFHHVASAWQTGTTAGLYFDLAPSAATYRLHVKFAMFASDRVRSAVHIALNDAPVECRWTSYRECEGEVDARSLRKVGNAIEFTAPTEPNYYDLALRLVSFSLVPDESSR
ncbi:MAG: hypothetical protein JSS16_06710 [Proteobacteria bacterium]|uniref:hypothetical protein n=1 Tax=Rudaea sp. TaxID=2136325 RepID=UPI001D99EE83|nr:hypothetical protein [Pseudomonadota bacterium]MBS0567901.1 hypothetical protein [Pseudomonadota bacterium]